MMSEPPLGPEPTRATSGTYDPLPVGMGRHGLRLPATRAGCLAPVASQGGKAAECDIAPPPPSRLARTDATNIRARPAPILNSLRSDSADTGL